MLDVYCICDAKRRDKIYDVWCRILLCGGFLCHVGKHLNAIFLSYKCNFCIFEWCFSVFLSSMMSLSFFHFLLHKKTFSPVFLTVTYVTSFLSFEKTRSLFLFKINFLRRHCLKSIFLYEHWYCYFYIFFVIIGMTVFFVFALYFFQSYEKHNRF